MTRHIFIFGGPPEAHVICELNPGTARARGSITNYKPYLCYAPCMDYLWTPWRYAYISTADQASGCVLCDKKQVDDRQAFIVHRGSHCYIVLNIFPYTSGHVMIVPYEHIDELQKLPPAAASEMMTLLQKMEGVLRQVYHPDGINLGMNIGKAAGAGLAGHLHMHVLPRWIADSNFMTTVGETRVLPEALEQTWERLRAAFGR